MVDKTENVIVFDLETQREIAAVGGREHLERLGVSIGVAYHVGERRFYHFDEQNLPDLIARLQAAELIVGYNIRHFDFPVLSAYTDLDLFKLPHRDLLDDIKGVLGYRVKLDSLAQQTLGIEKSADGMMALRWWQEGQLDLIRDYCQRDVDITRRLWQYGRDHGHVWYWDKDRQQRRPAPVRW